MNATEKLPLPSYLQKSSSISSSLSETSFYSQSTLPPKWTPSSTPEYGVYYSGMCTNLTYSAQSPDNTGSNTPVFFARTSMLMPGTPDVTIHDVRGRANGEDKTAPVVAVGRFRWSVGSSITTMGLGDPKNNPAGVEWEDMRNVGSLLTHNKYRFEYTTRNGSGASSRKSYTWTRTQSTADGVDGWGRCSLANYKLFDDATGQTIAVFLSNGAKSWRKCGKLRFTQDLNVDNDDDQQRLHLLIVLSSACIAEKHRRGKQRRNAAWYSGGGGGC